MTYKPTSRFENVPAETYYLLARDKEKEMLADSSMADDYFDLQAARKKLVDSIPNLGNNGADELLLKLGSWLNQTKKGK